MRKTIVKAEVRTLQKVKTRKEKKSRFYFSDSKRQRKRGFPAPANCILPKLKQNI